MAAMRRPTLPIAPLVLIVFTVVSVSLATGAPAWAQPEPPPALAGGLPAATPSAPPALLAPAGAPPPAESAQPPPPPAVTAPAAAGVPTQAPTPPLAPATPPSASLAIEPGALPPLPPEERIPMYKQPWFWAIVGVVTLTAVMITIGVATQGPKTPNTDLGNMRAY